MWSFSPRIVALCFTLAWAAAEPTDATAQSSRSGLLFRTGPQSGGFEFRSSSAPDWSPEAAPAVPFAFQDKPRISQGRAFLSSLVVPGLGQYQQGQIRWTLYAGVEALAGVLYFQRRGDARSLRSDYRDLAWQVARSGLSQVPRTDGDFVYFETLSKWDRSGAWDSDLGASGLQPEEDPATFNGSIWALAVDIFDIDPADPSGSLGYQAAIDFYMNRGYGPEFLWDWNGTPGARDDFTGLINESDSKFRSARQAVGLLLANHIFSALDGLITARLEALPGSGTELGLRLFH